MQASVNLDALLEKMKAELERAKRSQRADLEKELDKLVNCLDAVSERDVKNGSKSQKEEEKKNLGI